MKELDELTTAIVSKTILNQLTSGNINEFVNIQLPISLPVDLVHAFGEICNGFNKEQSDIIFSRFISNLIGTGFSVEAKKLSDKFINERASFLKDMGIDV